MAAARRQQEYEPLSLDYVLDTSEPIYLVDVDGTLIKRNEQLNDGLVAFLKDKPNVFLFTKMSRDTVVIGIANVQQDLGPRPLLIRYNLINELRKKRVTIQGVITPGDVNRLRLSDTDIVPGTHYVNYLGKLEYDTYIKQESDKPAFLNKAETDEEQQFDYNSELKNEMYNMAKTYFTMVFGHKGPIVFIDDEPQQLLSVGMQELIEPIQDSIPLILIHVDPIDSQRQEVFTRVTSNPQIDKPSETLYANLANIIGDYFTKLRDRTPQAQANKKREFLDSINGIGPIPQEKSVFIEGIREFLVNWPAALQRVFEPTAAQQAPTLTGDVWRCPMCDIDNPSSNIKCKMCRYSPATGRFEEHVISRNQVLTGTAAQARNARLVTLKPGQWQCGACTFINEPTSPKCEACQRPRYPTSGGGKKIKTKSKSKSKSKKATKTQKTKKTKKNIKSKKMIKKTKKTNEK